MFFTWYNWTWYLLICSAPRNHHKSWLQIKQKQLAIKIDYFINDPLRLNHCSTKYNVQLHNVWLDVNVRRSLRSFVWDGVWLSKHRIYVQTHSWFYHYLLHRRVHIHTQRMYALRWMRNGYLTLLLGSTVMRVLIEKRQLYSVQKVCIWESRRLMYLNIISTFELHQEIS